VHHAGSKIPFYRLPQVLKDHPRLNAMSRVTLREAFNAKLRLWDEASGRLVSFRAARRAAKAAQV
jgi:omega-6 fatty acid desaturase (delta-12 desaturase)